MPDRRSLSRWLGPAAVALACAPGCARHAAPASPGLITHVVLISLQDPADAPAVIKDCDQLARAMPGVVSSSCGPPFDSGRPTVDGAYDVGFVLGFDSPASLDGYVKHPAHVALVEKWKPRVRSMRVHDVLDVRAQDGARPKR